MNIKLLFTFLTFLIINICTSQIVNIPDTNFKTTLLAHNPIIDINGDGEIQITEANSFFGLLDVSQSNISNLTGIEAFTNITELLCNNNSLSSLNIAANTNLLKINCAANSITELYLAQNTALVELECNGNSLTSLDTSLNTNLEVLNVAANSISSLNLSSNVNLKSLELNFNPITTIDISNNINLETFSATYCYSLSNVDFSNNSLLESISLWYSNQTTIDVSNMQNLRLLYLRNLSLTSLDVTNNLELFNLYVTNNNISQIDVSNNSLLAYLSIDEYYLNTIDVSNNQNLVWLDVSGNQLQTINAKNGTNTLFTNFQVDNAANLQSVCVDNVTYATSNFNIPSTAFYTDICSAEDCGPIAINHFESFETIAQPGINPCWRKVPEISSSTNYIKSTATSHTGENGITMHSNFSEDAFFITPQLLDFNSSKRISFWVYDTAQTPLSIGTLSNPNDVSTYTMYSEISSSDEDGYQWRKYKIDFSDYVGTDTYVALKLTGYAVLSIDDFSYLESPSCIEPVNLSSIAFASEALLNWSNNTTATSWDIEYGEEGFTQGTGTIVNTTTKPFTLTGLTSDTDYSFYVRANCGTSDQGYWSSVSNFTTLCEAVNAEYNYSFEDAYPTQFNTCWTSEGNMFVDTSGGSNPQSQNYLNMYSYSEQSTIVTPELIALDNTKRIKFWINNIDGESGLIVGTVQDPNNLTTFTPYQTFTASELSQNEWKKIIVNFDSYFGNDRFVALRQVNSTTGADIYIDEFTYQEIPTCLEPVNAEVISLTDTEISLQWLEQAAANSWEIEYGISGFAEGNGTVINASAQNVTISSLTPDTQYDIYVRSICSTSNSSEATIVYNVNTACGPTQANYYQNFDASLEMANCWLTIPEVATGDTNAYEVTISNQYKVGTTGYSARFVDYDLETNVFLISPEFSDLGSGNNRVKFWLHTRYTDSNIIVGTISDPSNSATFTPIETILSTDMVYREWKQFTVNLDGYLGTDTRVAFKMELTGDESYIYDFVYFDNFEYTTIPTCATPTALENVQIANGELTLAWQDNNGATQWEIEYGQTGFWQGEGTTIQTTANPYNIQGLSLDTTYDFYVRAICDNQNTSDWSNKLTVNFGCGESYNVGYTHNFNNATLDECWTAYEYPSGGSYTNISVSNTVYNGTSGNSMYLQDSSNYSSNGVLLVSPVITDLSTDKKIEFYINNYDKGLIVGTMSDPSDYTTFTALETITGEVDNTTWEKRIVYLTNYNGTDSHIAFKQQKQGYYDGNGVYLDDFAYLQSVICNPPTDLTISNSLDTSVAISFTGTGVENQWEIEYDEVDSGTTNSQQTILLTSENFTLDNLLEGTEYTIKIRSKCDDDTLYSNWSETITFSTTCLPQSANYFESFEFEDQLSPCWSSIATGNYANVDTANTVFGSDPVSGEQLVYLSNFYQLATQLYLISREISDIDNTKRIRFSLISKESSTSSTYNQRSIEVGTMTDPTDASTFTLLDIIQPEEMNEYKQDGSGAVAWKEHTVYFDNYTASDNYIAIRAGSENTRSEFIIDDFYYEAIPECTEPLYPEVLDQRYDAVDITWDTYQNSSPQSWEVEYGPSGFALGTGITVQASTSSLTITNLIDDTNYDFYVRANCGNVFSEWSAKQTFKTKCIGFEVGYFENFDAFETGTIANCWTGLRPAATGSPYWDESSNAIPTISDNLSYSSNNAVRLFNETNHPDPNASEQIILVSPRLIGLDNYKVISFWLNPDSSAYATPAEIIIGTLSDPDDASTFTPYYTITNAYENEDAWTKYEIDFSDFYLNHEYVGIRQAYDNDRQLLYIDDFEYTENGCVTPTSLIAQQTNEQEVTLAWQDNNTAQAPNGWEIEYGPTGFTQGSGTTIAVTTNPYTITNLPAFTTYDFYVRANCNATNGYSNWSTAYTFNISCVFTAPFYENFDQYQATDYSNLEIPNFCWSRSDYIFYSGVADVSHFYASFGTAPNNAYVGYGEPDVYNDYALPGYLASPYLSDFDESKMLKFSLRNNSNNYQYNNNTLSGIVVGTMSNPTDRSTFTPFTTIEASEIDIFGREFVVDFSTYTGNDKHIVFMHDASHYDTIYIDNVYYQNIPTCLEPINVKSDWFTDQVVSISWENSENSGNYQIEYGEAGFTQGSGTLVTTSNLNYEINGLTPNTNYDFYVKSICNTENSEWSLLNATTACSVENLPWEENFDTMSSYGQGILPECFTGEDVWVSSNTNLSSYQVGEDDTHYLYVTYDEIGLNTSLITPMFNLEAGTTYNFVFKIRKEAGDYSSQGVKIRTGLGNTHQSMTTNLNSFGDFDYGFYNFYPIETTFTPVISGAYSFGVYVSFSSPVNTITLDSFSMDGGYEGLIDPETAPEVYDFETALPDSFILEETVESRCSVVTEETTNNKAISMKLRSAATNWVETPDNNQKWVQNQNKINKINFEIDATDQTSLFMNFDLKQFFVNNPNESMFRVVANGNVVLDNIYATSNTNYTNYEVDLSSLVGQNIRISMQQLGRNLSDTSNPSDEAFVDNLKFTNTSTLSVETSNFVGLTYYPNPIESVFYIKNNTNIDAVEVYNMFGQKVLFNKVNSQNTALDLTDLPSAVYFVKVKIADKEQTLKVIKK